MLKNKIKAYMCLKGINQADMAKFLGIYQHTFSLKLNGKTPFTLEESKKIADYFETTVDEIFFEDTVNFKATIT